MPFRSEGSRECCDGLRGEVVAETGCRCGKGGASGQGWAIRALQLFPGSFRDEILKLYTRVGI
jgi:hypothetical protein